MRKERNFFLIEYSTQEGKFTELCSEEGMPFSAAYQQLKWEMGANPGVKYTILMAWSENWD
jgi:hypothetical protein